MDELLKNIPLDAERTLSFFVNGKKVIESAPQPEWTLLWYLRNKLQLTGTKYGCGEGGCGACTVMLSQILPDQHVKHIAVNACLTPVCAVHGLAVTTVEGIGSVENGLHPVQERIAKAHGSQCGFCTPGFVMSMYTLLRNQNKLEYEDIETALQGNLCRCTGYRPIIEGFKTFTEGWQRQYGMKQNGCSMGENCCKTKNNNLNNKLYDQTEFKPYDPSQEVIFPPELKVGIKEYTEKFLFYKSKDNIWLRPKTLKDLLCLKSSYPSSKIVAGNTEIQIEMNGKGIIYPVLISTSSIPELSVLGQSEDGFVIGSAVSLTDIQTFMKETVKTDSLRSLYCDAIAEMLHWFAGAQVRNVASIAGNIVTASPISDLNPILMACKACINVESVRGKRRIQLDESFFTAYRKTALGSDEIVLSIEIPYTVEKQYFKAYKQARRKDDDISIVTAAFNVVLDDNRLVKFSRFCFGGMAPTTVCAAKCNELIEGKEWNDELLHIVFNALNERFQLDLSVPGGMAEYRKSLCLSMFFKFYMYVMKEISSHDPNSVNIAMKNHEPPESSQYFEIKDNERKPTDSIGLPVTHASALKQATGEALYCDDIPHVQNEVFLTLIFSKHAHAKILNIDASKSLSMPGVVAFLSAKDIEPDRNKFGPVLKDEEIFSTHVVTSQACVIGAIIAEDEFIAKQAKKLVEVTYEPLEPIITIEDAIRQGSYLSGSPRKVNNGDINKAFKESHNIIEGCVRNGAQEHFYLETGSAFAVRKEDELEIISSTQSPAQMAVLTASVLKLPTHKVVVKTKRIGGGFGGKETRSAILTVPVAVAAYKLKRPVRAVFERDEDMQSTGYRHPVLVKYKVGFNNHGKILGASFNVYCNAGNSMDISSALMERVVLHADNAYYIPNVEINGYVCKTNLPSNTAFRGFGAPQIMFATENMIRDISNFLNKPYEDVASLNMYEEGHFTHYNQKLTYCTLGRCWNECVENSEFKRRLADVEAFNRSSRWQKKGIAVTPTKYGISFQSDFLMQAGALLHIYTDGSVLLSIGGIEMGQGLFTKMIQVASKALDIEIDKIHISEAATDKVPNSSPTAASISSDLYGMAVIAASNTLSERLKPYKEANPKGKWEDWINAAYFDRVQLSATGFYCAPKITYNRETNSGDMFEYFTYGVACSEVLVDCLTGDHTVLRTDIVMDVGESLNPAIDIGQIEGGFMQGYGLFTLEELVFSPNGSLLSKGPGAYKIPAIADIPKKLNVSLLKGAPNPRAVYSSKAVGEPPLFLAASIFFAIKEAIKAARLDAGASKNFAFIAPATCERIRMACEDDITRQVRPTVTREGKTPWNIIV